MNLKKILKSSQRVALNAGDYVLSNLGRVKNIEFKGERNLVTEVDRKSEEIIKSYLLKKYPDFNFVGEESGGDADSEYCWLVDPIDGTNNFSHTFPVFCVSIALLKDKKPVLGVIYDPTRKEVFSAISKDGAYLNGKRISVSKIDQISRSLVATGFHYEFKDQADTNIEHCSNFIYHTQGVRRCGAAALDLAYVASGRLDGFWELGLNPWDTAAGILLIEEAGGKVTQMDGEVFSPFYPNIVSSNGLLHQEMLRIISLKDKLVKG
ncbi:MAG: inositol monophosphatase family protein [Candidatus Kaelpia aquatica]|nr:inositol monophosphatase family protein [Candidatus Kaelpia aquatica]